jgi:hypothetical protein
MATSFDLSFTGGRFTSGGTIFNRIHSKVSYFLQKYLDYTVRNGNTEGCLYSERIITASNF